MSGLDEVKTLLIVIPAGVEAGKVPRYWSAINKKGEVLCWLQQRKPGTRAEFNVDFILNKAFNEDWHEEKFHTLVSVESVLPHSYQSRSDSESIIGRMVIGEMRRVFKRKGFVLN